MNDQKIEKKKNYRPNVAAIILSSKYPEKVEIFIASRSDVKDAWQFPQGGIDGKETPKEALLRELEEEIGTNKVEIIDSFPEWVSYDFPETIAKKMYPFDGQRQKYFLVRLKPGAKIDVNTKVPEFSQYTFVPYDKIFDYVTYFKRPIYKKILTYFRKKGYM